MTSSLFTARLGEVYGAKSKDVKKKRNPNGRYYRANLEKQGKKTAGTIYGYIESIRVLIVQQSRSIIVIVASLGLQQ
jgi:hypothetical protein